MVLTNQNGAKTSVEQQERPEMKTKRRWLNSALKESKTTDLKMPWARGATRVTWKSRCAARATGT